LTAALRFPYRLAEVALQRRYVDLITEPGADKAIIHGAASAYHSIEKKVGLSLDFHQSS